MPTQFHLMVIDDLPSDQLLLQDVLEQDFPDVRCTAIPVTQTVVACCLDVSSRPHLILLDLHLGPVSGLDLLRDLKAHPATRGIPVVVYSGSAHPDDVRAAYDEHASGYLVKPLALDDLRATLTHLITHWRDVRTAPPSR